MAQPFQKDAVYVDNLFASGDLSTKQYYLMKMSSGAITTNDTAGGPCLGVLMNKPTASTQVAQVAVSGTVPCVAGGSVSAGDRIKSDGNGKGVAAQAAYVNTSDSGAAQDPVVGSNVIGIALSDAASGEQFNLQIRPEGAIPTTAA